MAVVAALLLLPAASGADEHAQARAHFERASQLFDLGRFAAARVEFEAAYRLVPDARVLANTAACFVAERRPVEALRRYRRFLSASGEQIAPSLRRRTEREIRSLRRSAGDMALGIEPWGAEIRIDGDWIGVAPLPWPVAVAPGPRRLEVRAPGHGSLTRTILVERDRQVAVTIVLAPRDAAQSPGAPDPYGNGGTFRLDSGEDRPRRHSLRAPLLWAGVGLTAALSAGAAVVGAITLGNEHEYARSSTTVERRRALYDDTRRLSVVTDILIDAAVVAGIATLAYYLFGKSDARRGRPVARRVTLGPVVGKGGAPCELFLAF